MAKAKKGWHPDPTAPGRERHWDGETWGETRDAPPAKRKRRGGTFLKVTLGIIVGLTVVIGGCAALVGTSVDHAVKDTKKESDKNGITMTQYHAIKIGTLRTDVRAQLVVPPASKDDTQIQDYQSSCLYYNRKGHLFDIFQFCFEHHKLVSKSSI